MNAPPRIKKKTGPTPKPIDEKVVEGMALSHATTEEIADFCGVSRDTIERRFMPVIIKARAETKKKLRKAQFDAAMKGNSTMLVWLGKVILGQKEVTVHEFKNLDLLTDEELEKVARGEVT